MTMIDDCGFEEKTPKTPKEPKESKEPKSKKDDGPDLAKLISDLPATVKKVVGEELDARLEVVEDKSKEEEK